MEDVKSFFDSFKEFIWDIVGYLLPGSFLLIVLSATVKKQYFFSSELASKEIGMQAVVFIIISYCTGYCIYGLGLLKEIILGKYSYTKQCESNIEQKDNFKIAKQFVIKELSDKGNPHNLSTSSVREVRNIAMGFSPESDQKIYTFMFRSEISHHLGNILLSLGFLGIVGAILDKKCDSLHSVIFFRTELKFIILYVAMILSYCALRQARNRFYAIAIGLPFSVLISKLLNK